jgi:hypothetical protein
MVKIHIRAFQAMTLCFKGNIATSVPVYIVPQSRRLQYEGLIDYNIQQIKYASDNLHSINCSTFINHSIILS